MKLAHLTVTVLAVLGLPFAYAAPQSSGSFAPDHFATVTISGSGASAIAIDGASARVLQSGDAVFENELVYARGRSSLEIAATHCNVTLNANQKARMDASLCEAGAESLLFSNATQLPDAPSEDANNTVAMSVITISGDQGAVLVSRSSGLYYLEPGDQLFNGDRIISRLGAAALLSAEGCQIDLQSAQLLVISDGLCTAELTQLSSTDVIDGVPVARLTDDAEIEIGAWFWNSGKYSLFDLKNALFSGDKKRFFRILRYLLKKKRASP